MSSYTWDTYPLHGATNFELTARTALETWRTNGASMEVRLNELEDGTLFSGLVTPIIPSTAIISLDDDLFVDGSISVAKLAVTGADTDGSILIYRDASAGYVKEILEGAVGGDTYQVKMNLEDTPGYVESKVATDTELIAGESFSTLVTPAGLKLGNIAASHNKMGVVSGAVAISPTHQAVSLELNGDTEITFTGFSNPDVLYSFMLRITNNGHMLSFANSIRWPGDLVRDLNEGRYTLMVSCDDGGTNFDLSEAVEYA